MKQYFWLTLILLTHSVFGQNDFVKDFVNPTGKIVTSVYWYWISDNISKEGVVRDLHAMKEAGINRAFIGNINVEEVSRGKVKMLSEEWWEILHIALKTASELNIEIGVFNSAGWSQSGGPWIQPSQSMRYLTSSLVKVSGKKKVRLRLAQPTKEFQDVKVIAFPVPKDDSSVLNSSNGIISSIPEVLHLENLVDSDTTTGLKIPEDNQFIIEFSSNSEFNARSLSIYVDIEPIFAEVKFQQLNGDEYTTIKAFEINRTNSALNVGFAPFAPIVVSFPPVTAKKFRLVFKNIEAKQFAGANLPDIKTNPGITEIILSGAARTERYSEKSLAKMYQLPLPPWDAYTWNSQSEPDDSYTVIDTSKVIDISSFLNKDGVLTWEVPGGDWIIMRTGMTPTGVKNSPAPPEATGLEVDKLSDQHIRSHFNAFIGKILTRIPANDRKTFKVVVMDSYESGSQNFTDNFLNDFKQAFGYDALPFLPVLRGYVVSSSKTSDRFLWDLRRFIADRVAYKYVGGLRTICNQNGLTTWLEGYGHWGFPGEFLQYGGQSDEIAGEFWSKGTLGDVENRAASSTGHIYGKNIISSESFTIADKAFSQYPAALKSRGDKFFAEGINNTLLHVFISQPYSNKYPGVNSWFGNEFNHHNTWFSQIDLFINYIKRCNYMLQQGVNVADVAYFIGEDVPKMTGTCDPALPKGYQFDFINAEVMENSLTVRDNLLTLPHGTSYKILVLPKMETMRPEVLTKIRTLIYDGAIVLGPAPKRSPSNQNQPRADYRVHQLAAEIWGKVDGVNEKYSRRGKGMIMNGLTLEEAFSLINCIPDCQIGHGDSIDFAHRTTEDGEIYFLTNQTAKSQSTSIQFRVKGKRPELWDATTGKIRLLPAFVQGAATTTVPLQFEPNQSMFIVFRYEGQSTSNDIYDNFPSQTVLKTIEGPWNVSFESKIKNPRPISMSQLQDLTLADNDSVKYLSGTATYTTQFHIDKLPVNKSVILNIHNVNMMAKAWINGKYVGGVWTPPYQIDITEHIVKGVNTLRFDVVNTWVNRLIGDFHLPTYERETWTYVNSYNANSSLQPSGIVGPVEIRLSNQF